MATKPASSPGHKLGQMIGQFFEEFFYQDLEDLSLRLGLYFDKKGPRPGVRGKKTKLTWFDARGNAHDMDCVLERKGSNTERGSPAAFIEIAWRRYTKHSRNKTGEIEGALIHLRETYPSCHFFAAILGGEYTEGGKQQLESHGITVLHIPFDVIVSAFKVRGGVLSYDERAAANIKQATIEKWQSLSKKDIAAITKRFREIIGPDYSKFLTKLETTLTRGIHSVRLLPLYGHEIVCSSIEEAMALLSTYSSSDVTLELLKFEVRLEYTNGDKIEGQFHTKDEALRFLAPFAV